MGLNTRGSLIFSASKLDSQQERQVFEQSRKFPILQNSTNLPILMTVTTCGRQRQTIAPLWRLFALTLSWHRVIDWLSSIWLALSNSEPVTASTKPKSPELPKLPRSPKSPMSSKSPRSPDGDRGSPMDYAVDENNFINIEWSSSCSTLGLFANFVLLLTLWK